MSSSERKEIWGMSYMEIAIIVILLCIGCVFAGILGRKFLSNFAAELQAENNTTPTQKARPNYQQTLVNNGFAYNMNDGEGNPIYVSNCGCVAVVRPNSVGFAVNYNPDNDCAMQDLGAIISIMYPPDVFDFIVSRIPDVITGDRLINEISGAYAISMDFDRVAYQLTILIRDL